jgi:acyl-CoA reductase-like NAD-dependent aldehyde dehydrogenase
MVDTWSTISILHVCKPTWGGAGRSGIGRELGWSGIEDRTEEKVVTIALEGRDRP